MQIVLTEFFEDVDVVFIPGFDPKGKEIHDILDNISNVYAAGDLPPEFDRALPACASFNCLHVSTLPEHLALPACKNFQLSSSKIETLPKALFFLPECKNFSIDNCPGLTLETPFYLPKCKSFAINYIRFLKLSVDFERCVSFRLSELKVRFVDSSFLSRIKEIVLSDCGITDISPDEGALNLPSLDECLSLDLTGNKIDRIIFPNLPKCKEVMLSRSNTEITSYGKRPDTPIIYINSFGLEKPSPDLYSGHVNDLTRYGRLTINEEGEFVTFELDGWPHSSLPLIDLDGCLFFSIKNSQIEEIPNEILDTLRRCKTFILHNNHKFRGLSVNLNLPEIQEFHVSNTPLHFLGRKLASDLNSCSKVVLWNARLTVLPSCFIPTSRFAVLYLSENSLSYLPQNVMRGLRKVEELDLSYNRFTDLFDVFHTFGGILDSCDELDLSNNPISDIQELPLLPVCKSLNLLETKPIDKEEVKMLRRKAPNAKIYASRKASKSKKKDDFDASSLPSFSGVLKCVNPKETIGQEEWSSELTPDLYIWIDGSSDPNLVLCYDSENVSVWLNQKDNIVAKWIAKDPSKGISPTGEGGDASPTEHYGQLYDVSEDSVYPMFIVLNDTYKWLKQNSLKHVIIRATKVDRVRVGNVQGQFGFSRLHGQLPEVDIYELEVMGKVLSE